MKSIRTTLITLLVIIVFNITLDIQGFWAFCSAFGISTLAFQLEEWYVNSWHKPRKD